MKLQVVIHVHALQVADFGLSRDVTTTNNDFTQNIGTVAYMPPEALATVAPTRTR